MPHRTALLCAVCPPKSSRFSPSSAARGSQPFIVDRPWDVLQGQQRKRCWPWGVRSPLGLPVQVQYARGAPPRLSPVPLQRGA